MKYQLFFLQINKNTYCFFNWKYGKCECRRFFVDADKLRMFNVVSGKEQLESTFNLI